ncbi:D-tyrosyl-tRNA(Tyr) deacylase [Limnohabitans sp. TS-CS-82]|uniref:D-aminoacyl-tRNA deacylase n=1 Tax=Limnohabitans sp. TS-CS-82 TaxID=2094193 RepID=UPI000CF2168F|nr:D-aminoacyl-tRNA deacylase [Limnohabitans sp. TS-CS-82]PQA82156.1 D-tyrosyl-tRNA(Tyr) deacylase [Limnohabitans sp. TS-CS-82]
MKAVLQRVSEARVVIDGQTVGEIGQGLMVLLCAEKGDTEAVGQKMLDKILKLRVFYDETGKMNHSVNDVAGGLLVVSQFTLAADTRSGTRPSFTSAASADEGRRLYDAFVAQAKVQHANVQTGVFGADMKVHLVNDGPVTIPITIIGA